jgi:hypothetical protein
MKLSMTLDFVSGFLLIYKLCPCGAGISCVRCIVLLDESETVDELARMLGSDESCILLFLFFVYADIGLHS